MAKVKVVKERDNVVILTYGEKGKDGLPLPKNPIRFGWHGDAWELKPGDSIQIPKAAADHIVADFLRNRKYVPAYSPSERGSETQNVILTVTSIEDFHGKAKKEK
jgi:hypothetical protein